MTLSDAALLAEVDHFLSSCEAPALPPIELRDVNEGESAPMVESMDKSKLRRRRRPQSRVDAVTRREREKRKDRERRAEYRRQRLKERAYLQQQVEELTSELTQRQQVKETEVPLSTTAWKLLARRLEQERLDSEAQQRRLRAEVNARATLIKDLYCRLACNGNSIMAEALCQRKRLRLDSVDVETFQTYLKELDGVYAKTHAVLTNAGVDVAEEDWDEWMEDVRTGYSHYKAKREMAVDFRRSAGALWEASHLHFRTDRQHLDEVPQPENTAAFKFRITARLQSGQVVSVVQRSVTRRYHEEGRVVVVWRSLLEGEGAFAGLHADNTGWDELTRSPTGATLRTYIHHVPMQVNTLARHQPALQDFNKVVLDSVSEVGQDIAKRFEELQIA